VLLKCTGICAGEAGAQDDGLTVFTYSGTVDVTKLTDFTSTFVLNAGQGLSVLPQGTQGVNAEPVNDLMAPGVLPVPPALFGSESTNENQEGLFVFVRDGHIEIATGASVLHLGRNEAGFAGNNGALARPQDIPRFLEFDRTPLPNASNFNVTALLGDSNVRSARICR
jgi:hypothetical protein